MVGEKPMLTLEELESQAAFELPERDMMALLTVIVAGNQILNNNRIAVAACVQIQAVAANSVVDCDPTAGA